MECDMKYTFSALIRPPQEVAAEIEVHRKEWTNRIIESVLVSGQPTDYWQVTKEHMAERFPNSGDWGDFLGPYSGIARLCEDKDIIELGIVIYPARFSFFNSGPGTDRKISGSQSNICITEEKGLYYYDVRSGADGVSEGAVGLFLTRKLLNRSWDGSGEKNVDFDYWRSFYCKAHDVDQVLRAIRKLDQLRGTRKNSGAFERLSAEVAELVCSAMM